MPNPADPLYQEYPELERMPLAESVAFLARQLLLRQRGMSHEPRGRTY